MQIVMNVAIGGRFSATPNDATKFSVHMLIDHVMVRGKFAMRPMEELTPASIPLQAQKAANSCSRTCAMSSFGTAVILIFLGIFVDRN